MSDSFRMPLDELLSKYAPVYPEGSSWDRTIDYLLSFPEDNAVITELMRQAEEQGGFREPVTLESDEDFRENNADLVKDGEAPMPYPQVVDGTHRVCAAILGGHDEVLVRFSRADSFSEEEYDGRVVITDIATSAVDHALLSAQGSKDSEPAEELTDQIFSLLRSFPLNDDEWVTASAMSGQGNRHWSILWDFAPDDVDDEFLARVDAKVFSLLKDAGIPVKSLNTYVEQY